MTTSSAYLWFDTEYSTLNVSEARLLQVALVITDVHLNRITPASEDLNLFIQLPEEAKVSPWVMETMPDLVVACRSRAAVSIEEADRRLAELVARYVVVPLGDDKKKPILAGNSIHADWYLARKYLPKFSGSTHYRHLDVTTLKLQWQDWLGGETFEKDDPEMIKAYCPGFNSETLNRVHDAYYDVQASIAELNYYRRNLFKPRAVVTPPAVDGE
ncbi:MAG TPA: exonuclease domain-containing protein [Kiritimatiellia bacterium]|nr:exonuclease domain-containing protein [Kiritimatiellia bacterium]